ncbi:hypothetical protein ES703_125747 [subsurface metagenome]
MLSKTDDSSRKKELCIQLDEINDKLQGLNAISLRRTLKDAGLPTEDMLVAEGRTPLQPQQVDQLKEEIAEVETLPLSDSIWDLLALGNAYYYAEQYQDAKNIYDKILIFNPNDPSTLNSRGATYAKLETYDKALADFNRSLELRHDDPSTFSNRSAAYIRLEKYDDALADFNRSLEIRPDNPATLHNRGAAYIHLERYDDALADFNRSLEIRPDNPATLDDRGITYSYLQRYDDALADYNRSLELRPDDPDVFFNLACLFSLWGKTDDALRYLEKAIELDKKNREDAKTDKDFDNIREDPRFKKLTESDSELAKLDENILNNGETFTFGD